MINSEAWGIPAEDYNRAINAAIRNGDVAQLNHLMYDFVLVDDRYVPRRDAVVKNGGQL